MSFKNDRPYQTGQLFEYECPYCYNVVGGTNNIAPASPCEWCGIFWGEEGPKVIQVGPPGAHAPEIPEVLCWVDLIMRRWGEEE